MLPGKSHMAMGLAAAAVALCLLSSALPAYLAGDPWQAMTGLALLSAASAAGLAAWRLHRRVRSAPEPQPVADSAELCLLETVAGVLRDGLIPITGFSEMLAHGAPRERRGPQAMNASRFILDSSEDLSRFVANLQDFVRHEQGRIRLVEQQVDAAELIEAALGICRGVAERADVVLVARLLDGVDLRCDAGRIRQAIANMVLWAAGTAPAGSVVGVRLFEGQEKSVAISVTSMAELTRERVAAGPFDPHLPLDGLRGFALPVARRVALLHGGDLTIHSGPGAGITACLMLPPHRVIWPERAEASASRAA
jgi:two-component system, NarL family, sensor histidine kinase EvgS